MIKKIDLLKTKEDFMNVMVGGAFLGSGGGGPISAGISMINEILGNNKYVKVLKPEDLLDKQDLMGAVIAFVGSPSAGDKGIDFNSPINALNSLKIFTKNKKIDFVLPIELGAGNSLASIMVAALEGLYIVDGDGAGRAVPKIQMTTYVLNSSPVPAAFSNGLNEEDDNVRIDNIINMSGLSYDKIADKLEEYCLELCDTKEFDGMGGMALYLMSGSMVKDSVVSNTLSLAYHIGNEIQNSFTGSLDMKPVDVLKNVLESIGMIFYTFDDGEVIDIIKESDEGGLDKGNIILKNGMGDIMKINYINENLFSTITLNGTEENKIWAMGPDLICYMTNDGYGPISNVEIKKGIVLTVFGIKANERIRCTKIVKSFESVLKNDNIYCGSYIPIEKLQDQLK